MASRSEWGREVAAALFDHCSTALAHFLASAQRAGRVDPGLDVHRAARLLLALNDGLILQWQTQPDRVKPEEFLEPMADMITGYLTSAGKETSGTTARPKGRR